MGCSATTGRPWWSSTPPTCLRFTLILTTHAMIPENTTVCLFTTWLQEPTVPLGRDANGLILYDPVGPGNLGEVYPLLPSYGQLNGYMQADGRDSARDNARLGWGG